MILGYMELQYLGFFKPVPFSMNFSICKCIFQHVLGKLLYNLQSWNLVYGYPWSHETEYDPLDTVVYPWCFGLLPNVLDLQTVIL